MSKRDFTVVGIDVGGLRKGYHAVAFNGGQYAERFATPDAKHLVDWSLTTVQARVVAVDAPCGWSADGRARPAEREAMKSGIWCFSTPSRQMAVNHPRSHFGWMLQGEKLFKRLSKTHPLLAQLPASGRRKYCFETYPHAITWHLRGGQAQAKLKRQQRREVLSRAGIDLTELTNIDYIDAALCALTAHRVALRMACKSYGDASTGLIVVPENLDG